MILDHPDLFYGTAHDFLTSKKRFYACPTSQARNILALPFQPGEGHPFTEGIRDYLSDRTLSADATRMARFYERFQPATLFDAFFSSVDHPLLKELDPTELNPLQTFSSLTYAAPWIEDPIPMGGFGQDMPESEGSHYLGPVSERHLTSEYARLQTVVQSIETHGFDIDKQSDTIRGYFLFHHDQSVCVIVGGNHRVGALAALNSPFIPVEQHPHRPQRVSLDTIDSWPMVQAGTVSQALAQAVFLRFFSPSFNVIP